jgi:hypothetical protein
MVTAVREKATGAKVPLIAADKALLSLRSSGHDYCSAVGEVVDNSLQADANTIRVRVFTTKKTIGKNKRATEVVERLAIGDDGDGMGVEVLPQRPETRLLDPLRGSNRNGPFRRRSQNGRHLTGQADRHLQPSG